jgi:hypothetical protein
MQKLTSIQAGKAAAVENMDIDRYPSCSFKLLLGNDIPLTTSLRTEDCQKFKRVFSTEWNKRIDDALKYFHLIGSEIFNFGVRSANIEALFIEPHPHPTPTSRG